MGGLAFSSSPGLELETLDPKPQILNRITAHAELITAHADLITAHADKITTDNAIQVIAASRVEIHLTRVVYHQV